MKIKKKKLIKKYLWFIMLILTGIVALLILIYKAYPFNGLKKIKVENSTMKIPRSFVADIENKPGYKEYILKTKDDWCEVFLWDNINSFYSSLDQYMKSTINPTLLEAGVIGVKKINGYTWKTLIVDHSHRNYSTFDFDSFLKYYYHVTYYDNEIMYGMEYTIYKDTTGICAKSYNIIVESLTLK